MKKTLLSLGLAVMAFGATAQLNGTGDGFTMDNLDATSQCLINAGLPNNGGIMNNDGASFASSQLTATGLELTSAAAIASGTNATWFALPAIIGSGMSASCSSLFGANATGGVDMTNNTRVTVVAVSDIKCAELELFVGGLGQWGPATSTFNTGTGTITAIHTFGEVDTEETFTFDFADLDQTLWDAWVARATIQSVGFRSKTDDAIFTIKSIKIGAVADATATVEQACDATGLEANASANGFEAFPNPAQDVINFNYTVNGDATVELANALGSAVATTTGTSMNVAELPAGIYFATLKVNGVATAVQRVQVQ